MNATKVGAHGSVLRMQLRILDRKLAHVGEASLGAVKLLG
jgi:hypothetical protein